MIPDAEKTGKAKYSAVADIQEVSQGRVKQSCQGQVEQSLGYRFVKRVFDIVFSAIVLVVGFVPGVILAGVIAVQSKGSPFYIQERIGRAGKPFQLYKFRSMVCDADDVGKYLTPEQQDEWETERKVTEDPRITSVGKFIRRTSLDELPQFANALIGDMSVIGPRPVVEDELAWLGGNVEEFLSVRPGITGWWQSTNRNDATWHNGERQRLELYYVQNQSFKLDAEIFLRTIGAMISGTGQ